jgi:hypothetical protein
MQKSMPHDKGTKTLQDEQTEQTKTPAIPKIDTNIDTTVSLDDISQYLKLILKELQSHDDEGEYIFQQGTATTDTALNIIDLLGILGYPVKGYVITNDGGNTIEVGHNLTPSMIDSTLQTSTTRFYPIYPNETHTEMFNRKVIRNIYIRTDVGISAYRMWLLW